MQCEWILGWAIDISAVIDLGQVSSSDLEILAQVHISKLNSKLLVLTKFELITIHTYGTVV